MKLAFALLGALALGCSSSTSDNPRPGAANSAGSIFCEPAVDNNIRFCPNVADVREMRVQLCNENQQGYRSAGCGAEYEADTACSASAPTWDCANGPPCEDELNGYLDCLYAFNERTGCTFAARDPSCPASKPVTFVCLTGGPPNPSCVRPSAGSMYCCP
jgi:hypothetical protein